MISIIPKTKSYPQDISKNYKPILMKKIILLCLIILVSSLHSEAQISAGDKNFERLAYTKAAANYEKALRRDTANYKVWAKLGDCYRLTRDSKNAERAYSKAVKGEIVDPINYLYYAEALMQNEKYENAKTQLEKFKMIVPSDTRGSNLKNGIDNLNVLLSQSGSYNVKPTNLNSAEADFCPVVYNGGVVFTSNRKNIEWVSYSHSWTGKQFFTMYHAKGSDASFGTPTLFAGDLQSKYHDGPACFNSAGTQMYFTRSNIEAGKVKKDDKEFVRLKLFTSNWTDNKWGIEIPFPYNSDSYSCAHPALSTDGKTLYYASDMPGGMGGMDIWKCEWNGTSWGTPTNLGTTINTQGNEIFPSLSEEGILFFASDGHAGLGGLDIFQSEKFTLSWKDPENLGVPINSSFDDFGIAYNNVRRNGYFSSNRKNEGSNDDIYYFEKVCTNTEVLIVDQESGVPLTDATVKVFENGTEISSVITDESGKFNKCLNPSRNYEFRAMKDKYTENKSSLTSAQITEATSTGTSVKLTLKKIPVIINIANLTGRVFNQDDKTAVSDQKVVLIQKPSLKELSTTTDKNGYFKFENLALDADYEVMVSKKDCGTALEKFNTKNISGTKNITLDLPMLCKGDVIRIENIYYDYNKSNIRPDAAVELDKVVEILTKYGSMTIELRSHTDARGKDEYNTKLSDSRAKSAVDYILTKGIKKSRLIAKGYGESQLLNRCKNGVECNEPEHEENRRTEFKILSM